MSELYEYFCEIHPEVLSDIDKVIDVSVYELLLKMKDGTEYIYDVDYDEFREPSYDEIMRVRIKQKHLNQQMLSRRAGVSKKVISDYLNKRVKPERETLAKIAKGLSCTLEDMHYKD